MPCARKWYEIPYSWYEMTKNRKLQQNNENNTTQNSYALCGNELNIHYYIYGEIVIGIVDIHIAFVFIYNLSYII